MNNTDIDVSIHFSDNCVIQPLPASARERGRARTVLVGDKTTMTRPPNVTETRDSEVALAKLHGVAAGLGVLLNLQVYQAMAAALITTSTKGITDYVSGKDNFSKVFMAVSGILTFSVSTAATMAFSPVDGLRGSYAALSALITSVVTTRLAKQELKNHNIFLPTLKTKIMTASSVVFASFATMAFQRYAEATFIEVIKAPDPSVWQKVGSEVVSIAFSCLESSLLEGSKLNSMRELTNSAFGLNEPKNAVINTRMTTEGHIAILGAPLVGVIAGVALYKFINYAQQLKMKKAASKLP